METEIMANITSHMQPSFTQFAYSRIKTHPKGRNCTLLLWEHNQSLTANQCGRDAGIDRCDDEEVTEIIAQSGNNNQCPK